MADYTAQVPIDYACMSDSPRPPLDPIAAQRWQELPLAQSPWLHDEVGRRMAERLRTEVAGTLDPGATSAEIDAEMRYLVQALAHERRH